MHIGLDLSPLLPEPTGVDIYMRELVRHLSVIDGQNRYTIFVNAEDRSIFADNLGGNFSVVPICLRPRPVRLLSQQFLLPVAAQLLKVDVLHSTSFLIPISRGSRKHVLTVHDMTFFTRPELHTPLRRSAPFRHAVAWSIRHAHVLLVPSETVRCDLCRVLPDVHPRRVRVVPHGIGGQFCPRTSNAVDQQRRRLGLPERYILHVGLIQPRKNLGRLVEAYRRLVTSEGIPEHLVLAGAIGWDAKGVLAAVRHPELEGRVHLLGYVDPDALPWLYAGARLFVFPSLDEGFGFPPLEALASAIPSIASDIPSNREKLHGACCLVEPEDTEALVDTMRRVLVDEELRQALSTRGPERARRFSWGTTARDTLRCYGEAYAD